ncbi:MAG TPA: prepilin peptidase [Gemmatimonadaceae bacterium]|nr:prepilin peptidase [Gemmatimonadaceae bacterium]
MSLIVAVLVFFVGASLGSFLNVCILRWPAEQSVVRPRSRCPGCGNTLAWYDNVPVVSWIVLRAKCRSCGQPISAMYPVVEAATGAIWLASLSSVGPTFLAVRIAVFVTILLGIAITDFRDYVIPDGFTVTGLGFVALASVVGVFTGDQFPFSGPVNALFGACVGAGAITIIGWLGEVALKKEAMGFGDSTLMAMAGAALGPGRALLTILLGAAIGAVAFVALVIPIGWWRARRRGEPFETPLVPFGVFLAPATVVALLWGDAFISWYVGRLTG